MAATKQPKTKAKKAPAKAKPAAKKPAEPKTFPGFAPGNLPDLSHGVQPVRVDNMTRRSDNDALEGHLVEVVSGPHKGRKGAYLHTATHDAKTGYPATILVLTRDNEHERIVVDYADARPAQGIR